jgi:hypothetical protein
MKETHKKYLDIVVERVLDDTDIRSIYPHADGRTSYVRIRLPHRASDEEHFIDLNSNDPIGFSSLSPTTFDRYSKHHFGLEGLESQYVWAKYTKLLERKIREYGR